MRLLREVIIPLILALDHPNNPFVYLNRCLDAGNFIANAHSLSLMNREAIYFVQKSPQCYYG